MKQILQYALGILLAFCLVTVFFFTSIEAGVYWIPGYFEKEYGKYQVTEAVSMEMEDLLFVTGEMMDYLRGDREDLHVASTIDGQEREFFNEREIAHMEDVRGLFLGAISIRKWCLILMAGFLLALFLLGMDFKRTFPRAVFAGTGLYLALAAAFATVIASDFSRYFIVFHKLFFKNDLWILDPDTDRLINIVPEGFFRDTALLIGAIFFLSLLLVTGLCLLFVGQCRRRPKAPLLFLCLTLFAVSCPETALGAEEWPSNISAQAEGAILMDASTGTVIWGQNIHSQYFPASITKIMTALLVIENCSLDETVTFSHNAVFNVEKGSSNAGINEGDRLSVKDCLYALLLKSANEAANALAEHVAGTTENFAEMMNAKAKRLGCTNTHFSNPSGLNSPNHYTSAYDMALIAKAAFNNPVFEEIDSTTYYKLPPNSINPEGLTIYPGHRMMRKSSPYYYPNVIGGKTGYTSLAGNTLVTCAEKDGMKLITVILKDSTPQYWTDTKNLLNFGFDNFLSIKTADYEKTYTSVTSDLNFAGLPISKREALVLDPDSRITLPKTADFSDAVPELSYDISTGDPTGAVAKINYRYNGRLIGSTFLEINEDLMSGGGNTSGSGSAGTERTKVPVASVAFHAEPVAQTSTINSRTPFDIPFTAWLILGSVGAIGLVSGGIGIYFYHKRKEEYSLLVRRERRRLRLRDAGVTQKEFNFVLENKRSRRRKRRR